MYLSRSIDFGHNTYYRDGTDECDKHEYGVAPYQVEHNFIILDNTFILRKPPPFLRDFSNFKFFTRLLQILPDLSK